MAKKNDVTELKAELSLGKLQKLYVFYGEEEYLKEYYAKKITDMVPDGGLEEFNRIKLDGTQDYGIYDDALEGMPMMVDRRIVLIRDSNIFTTRRSGSIVPPTEEQKAFWENKFSRLSDDTVVVFIEKNADKRSALFKLADKAGFTVNCEYLPEAEAVSYAIKEALRHGKKMDESVARYLFAVIDPGLMSLNNELGKLIDFCDEIIYKSDVDRVVSKSMSVQVFDITDGITEGNADKIFKVINSLKTQKESPFGILYLIYANVEKMLKLKLAGATSQNDAVGVLGGSPWIARRYLDSSKRFTLEELKRLVYRIPELDYEIKLGKVAEWQALEGYIFEALEKKV